MSCRRYRRKGRGLQQSVILGLVLRARGAPWKTTGD